RCEWERLFSARQFDRESAAAAPARALGFDGAVMRLREALDQSQPQSQSAMRSGLGPILLAKTLEHEWQKLGRNALAGIFDLHDCVIVLGPTGNFHKTTGLGELNCIVQQVRKHLLQSGAVADHTLVVPVVKD